MSDVHSDAQRSAAVGKASVDDGLRENRRELRGIRRYLVKMDDFLKARFSNPETAPLSRPSVVARESDR